MPYGNEHLHILARNSSVHTGVARGNSRHVPQDSDVSVVRFNAVWSTGPKCHWPQLLDSRNVDLAVYCAAWCLSCIQHVHYFECLRLSAVIKSINYKNFSLQHRVRASMLHIQNCDACLSVCLSVTRRFCLCSEQVCEVYLRRHVGTSLDHCLSGRHSVCVGWPSTE